MIDEISSMTNKELLEEYKVMEQLIYGKGVNDYYATWGGFGTECIIYYLDGRKKRVKFKTPKDCPKHEYERRPYGSYSECKICGDLKNESNRN